MHPSLRPVTVLLAAVMGTAAAQEPMPTVSKPPAIIRPLKAQELAIYEATGRTRPSEKRAVWITTPKQALAKAYTIVTPPQRHKSPMLFEERSKKPQ